MFAITAVFYLVGALGFLIFAEAETQDWGKIKSFKLNEVEEKIPLKK